MACILGDLCLSNFSIPHRFFHIAFSDMKLSIWGKHNVITVIKNDSGILIEKQEQETLKSE